MKYKIPLMHKLLPFLLIFILPNALFSQSTITGQIKDQNNKAVELIEIQLQNKDSLIIKSELTNAEGKFEITVDNDNYMLIVKNLGKKLYQQKIELNNNLNLGIITITQNPEQLKEVVVIARKKLIERKVDRLVFNVENSIAATGGDAVDALKVTPGIKVQNDKIAMIGKSGMAVMVDEKLMQLAGDDLINFLKTIPADNIKSIEVITTPPAKYDAEGNSGLVNIILKKAKKDSWSAALTTVYKQATYATGNVTGNFNYRKNKILILSSFNLLDGATAPVETSKIYYPDQLWSNNSQRKDFNNIKGANLGIDYQIFKKIKMGVQYYGGITKPNNEENNLNTITNNDNRVNYYIKTNAELLLKNQSNSFNYHIIYEIDTIGTKISADFDYFKYNSDSNRTFKSNNLDSNSNIITNTYFAANNTSENRFANYSAKIDIEMPLKFANISYGTKISTSDNTSNVAFYSLTTGTPILDLSQSNNFVYKENVNALYFSGTKKITDKWEIQAGLRMEITNTTGLSITLNQENKNNYSKLFPTSYIIYTPNENNIFSINYSKRINRPNFFNLNPFRWYDNPFSYTEGNPFLQPSFTDNLEFTYTRKQNWENKLYYSATNNGYAQLTIVEPTNNIQATKYENFFDTKIFGLSESYTFNKIKWLESVNSIDLSYSNSESKISITNKNRHGFNSYFSTNNSISFNKNLILGLNFWLNPAGVDELDQNSQSNQLDLSMKFFFLDRNLQISMVGNDVLSSNRPTYISYTNNIKQEYRNYYDYRSFRISLIYKIGNNKIKVEKRKLGNEEEKNRVDK